MICLVDSDLRGLAAEFQIVLGSDLVCKLQFILPFFARFKLHKMAHEQDNQNKHGGPLGKTRKSEIFNAKEAEIITQFAAVFHHIHRGLTKLRSLKAIGQESTLSAQTFRNGVMDRLKKIVRVLSVRCF